jgi:hypothetical protein
MKINLNSEIYIISIEHKNLTIHKYQKSKTYFNEQLIK